jgi:hypothetical protein
MEEGAKGFVKEVKGLSKKVRPRPRHRFQKVYVPNRMAGVAERWLSLSPLPVLAININPYTQVHSHTHTPTRTHTHTHRFVTRLCSRAWTSP